MLRFLALGILAAGLGGLSLVVFNRAESQPQAAGLVVLQPTTPGTSQTGHANISGTMKAGQFQGGGAGLTAIDATNIGSGTLSVDRLPVPLTLSGTSHSSGIIRGVNASGASDSAGVIGESNSGGGGIIGVIGKSNGFSGVGVSGQATGNLGLATGVFGRTDGQEGIGVRGLATHASGVTYGGLFYSNSTNGTGVLGEGLYGVHGETLLSTGRAVFGEASATSGTNYGVFGESDSSQGTGVRGNATATSGSTYGVYGQSDSTSGRGVIGLASATSGDAAGGAFRSNSTSGVGVSGWASAATGATFGVYGTSSSPTGFGVYSIGNMGASGTKPFRIYHPFDPTGKYLLHYAAESPMPQNFYVGNVVTDAKGYAWVELPDYFSEINTNFKYQLTVVDDGDSDGFVMAKISKKILANRFQIRTSKGNVEVSWRVDADRNDLYVRAYKPKDVVKKQDLDVGTYQHPELYGEPPEKGLNYRGQEFGNPGQR